MNEYRDKNTGNVISDDAYRIIHTFDFLNKEFECCDKFKLIGLDFEYTNNKRMMSGWESIDYFCPICGKKLYSKMLSRS